MSLARYASDRGDAKRGLALLRRAEAPPDHDLVTLLEELEDLKERLSVHERTGVTISADKLSAELGLCSYDRVHDPSTSSPSDSRMMPRRISARNPHWRRCRSPRRPSHHERMDDRRHATPHNVVGCDSEAAGAHQLHGRAVAEAAACEAAPWFAQIVLARREEP